MNILFQELKKQYLMAQGEEKETYLSQMRDNLKQRNGDESLYTNIYILIKVRPLALIRVKYRNYMR